MLCFLIQESEKDLRQHWKASYKHIVFLYSGLLELYGLHFIVFCFLIQQEVQERREHWTASYKRILFLYSGFAL